MQWHTCYTYREYSTGKHVEISSTYMYLHVVGSLSELDLGGCDATLSIGGGANSTIVLRGQVTIIFQTDCLTS